MKAVRNKDSKIELALRKSLWGRGIRYRKNKSDIIGKPDIVFVGKKVAVFCDSEFWHGKDWEVRKGDFKSHQAFWIPKIERNIQRDLEVNHALEADGWLVLRFWGKEILKNPEGVTNDVCNALKNPQKTGIRGAAQLNNPLRADHEKGNQRAHQKSQIHFTGPVGAQTQPRPGSQPGQKQHHHRKHHRAESVL